MSGATVTGMCPQCFRTESLQVREVVTTVGELSTTHKTAQCRECGYGNEDAALFAYVNALQTHAPVDLVMVGDTTTGKTALITALVYQLRRKARESRERRLDDGWAGVSAEDIHPSEEFGDEFDDEFGDGPARGGGSGGGASGRQRLAGNLDRFIDAFQRGEFPSRTAAGLQPPLIVRISTRDGRPMRNCQVIIRDVPGEAFDADAAIRRSASYLRWAQNVAYFVSLPTLTGRIEAEGRAIPKDVTRTPDALLRKYKLALDSLNPGCLRGQSLLVVVSLGDELLHLEVDRGWMGGLETEAERATVRKLGRFLKPDREDFRPGDGDLELAMLDDSVESLERISPHVRSLLLMLGQENFVNTVEGSFDRPVRYCLVTASGPTKYCADLVPPRVGFDSPPKPRGVLMLLNWALAEDARRDAQEFERVRATIDERRSDLLRAKWVLANQRPQDEALAKPLEGELGAAGDSGHSREASLHLERFDRMMAELNASIARDAATVDNERKELIRRGLELGKGAIEQGYGTEKRSEKDNREAMKLLELTGVRLLPDARPIQVLPAPIPIKDVLNPELKKRLEAATEGFDRMQGERFGLQDNLAGTMRFGAVGMGLAVCVVLRWDHALGLAALVLGLVLVGAVGAFAVGGQTHRRPQRVLGWVAAYLAVALLTALALGGPPPSLPYLDAAAKSAGGSGAKAPAPKGSPRAPTGRQP